MNELKAFREARGLSQTQLAVRAGLSNSTVSEFERGERKPWPRARHALAEALGVRENVLFPGMADETTPSSKR